MPPPGSYDVDASYKRSQLKKDPAPPRNEEGAKRKEAFASSSSRFAPPRDIVIKKADAMNPGKYLTINLFLKSCTGCVLSELLKIMKIIFSAKLSIHKKISPRKKSFFQYE